MRNKLEEAAQEVFDQLGSGWTESIYHRALERELSERSIPFHSEGTIPVMYKGAPVGRRRPDLFIVPENQATVIVELKAGSNSGNDQLMQYLDMTEADANLGEIRGGAIIKFNEELEFVFVELGPEPNPDDSSINFDKLKDLPNGIEVYQATEGDNSVQINVNHLSEIVNPNVNDLKDVGHNKELIDFIDRACKELDSRVFGDD